MMQEDVYKRQHGIRHFHEAGNVGAGDVVGEGFVGGVFMLSLIHIYNSMAAPIRDAEGSGAVSPETDAMSETAVQTEPFPTLLGCLLYTSRCV